MEKRIIPMGSRRRVFDTGSGHGSESRIEAALFVFELTTAVLISLAGVWICLGAPRLP